MSNYILNDLEKEAMYFHFQIFGFFPNKDFILNYCNAHSEISYFLQFKSSDIEHINFIVKKNLDAPGIEFWTRKFSLLPALTSKLLLISYIAETDGKHRKYYKKNVFSKVKWRLIIFYSSFRIFRGFFQLLRYQFV